MRIVSLSPSATEIIFAVGKGEDIVANTYFCDYPQEARRLPKVGSWIRVDFNKVQSYTPDLVITSTVVQEQICAKLHSLGVPVYHSDPRSLTDIYKEILRIAKLVNAETSGRLLVEDLKVEEATIRGQSCTVPDVKRPKVYIEEWYDQPMMSGNWMPDIIDVAGGQYGVIKNGEISRKVTLEEITQYEPDIIFASYCGFNDRSDISRITERPGWSMLRAVQKGLVFPLDDRYLNRPGPRLLNAADTISTVIQDYLIGKP